MLPTRYVRSSGPALGRGTYGTVRKYVNDGGRGVEGLPPRTKTVHLAQSDAVTGGEVAVKKAKLGRQGIEPSVYAEIRSLQELQHPNVVRLLDVCPCNNGKVMLVLECCATDMNRVLTHGCGPEGSRSLPPPVAKAVMVQLLHALAHCHSKGIAHLDMKPSNLLLNRDGVLKLADFGMSAQLTDEPRALHPLVVTLWYRAPELLFNARAHTVAVDMWAAGCILGELCAGRPLFDATADLAMVNQIVAMLGPPTVARWPGFATVRFPFCFPERPGKDLATLIPPEYGPEAVDLLSRLLCYDPCTRLTAEQALSHPYFTAEPAACGPSELAALIPPPNPTGVPGVTAQYLSALFGMGEAEEEEGEPGDVSGEALGTLFLPPVLPDAPPPPGPGALKPFLSPPASILRNVRLGSGGESGGCEGEEGSPVVRRAARARLTFTPQ